MGCYEAWMHMEVMLHSSPPALGHRHKTSVFLPVVLILRGVRGAGVKVEREGEKQHLGLS